MIEQESDELSLNIIQIFGSSPIFYGTGRALAGFVGALFMGLVVGLVAAACIGPIISGLILFVAKLGNPVLGFLLFFVLALGMGTPYLALGTFSGAIKSLPRSGGAITCAACRPLCSSTAMGRS